MVRKLLGEYQGGHFCLIGVRELASKKEGGFWQQLQWGSISSGGDFGSGLHVCGFGRRPRPCDFAMVLHAANPFISDF